MCLLKIDGFLVGNVIGDSFLVTNGDAFIVRKSGRLSDFLVTFLRRPDICRISVHRFGNNGFAVNRCSIPT